MWLVETNLRDLADLEVDKLIKSKRKSPTDTMHRPRMSFHKPDHKNEYSCG